METNKTGENVQDIDRVLRFAELGLDAIKWIEGTSGENITLAAKSLWMSNAGGIALIAGLLGTLNLNLISVGIFCVAVAIFIAGVYLGASPHVHMAHNTVTYTTQISRQLLGLLQGGINVEQLQKELNTIVTSIKGKELVTRDLFRAKYCLAVGSVISVIGIVSTFV